MKTFKLSNFPFSGTSNFDALTSWALLGPSRWVVGGAFSPVARKGASARWAVGGAFSPVARKQAQNARDIPHFSHLAAILPHLVAHLVHLKPTYASHAPSDALLRSS